MPVYDFLNTTTNEIFEKRMSFADKELYLQNNPEVRSYFSTDYSNIPLMDPYKIGRTKPPQGWTDRLKEIHRRTPGSQLDKFTRV